MPLPRPTLAELNTRSERDLAARLGLDQLIPQGPASALAHVIAGMVHQALGRIDYQALQTWPDTAEATSLDVWGARLSLPRKAAAKATGVVVFSGTSGLVIPVDTLLQRQDGAKFLTTAQGTIVGGVANVAVIAVQAGTSANSPGGTALTLASLIVGTITSVVVEVGGIRGGSDQEGDEQFRRRLVKRLGQAPAAGTHQDYERWALEVGGVTRAWAIPGNQGAGTVGVTFVLDDDPVSIIPNAAKVAEVQAYIDARRPEPATVLVFAPALLAIDFTVEVTPDTTEVRDAVAASLAELLEREGEPASTIPLSHVREAISLAPGETDHQLTVPAADLVIGAGQIPAVGTITWV